MSKVALAFLVVISLSACGQFFDDQNEVVQQPEQPVQQAANNADVVVAPGMQESLQAVPPTQVADVSNTPSPQPQPQPQPESDTNTGSTEPVVVAQTFPREYHPRHYQYQPNVEPKAELKGLTSEETITLEIKNPPFEFNTCEGGMRIAVLKDIPVIEKEMQFNNWWLVASRIGINRLTPEKPVYFYWATKVAEDEIGVVPANFSTDKLNVNNPADVKIDTGFAKLPYAWIDQLHADHPYPHFPEECRKG